MFINCLMGSNVRTIYDYLLALPTAPPTTISTCADAQFRCNNGRCIQKDNQCNGRNDCSDNSDEDNCFTTAGSLSASPFGFLYCLLDGQKRARCNKSVDILKQTCYQQADIRMRSYGLRLWLPKCVNIRCHVYVFKYSIY